MKLVVHDEEVGNFEEMARETTNFFRQLYMRDNSDKPLIENLFGEQLTSGQVDILEMPFCIEEGKEAIFSIDKAKAPGPDGFSMLFFQEC